MYVGWNDDPAGVESTMIKMWNSGSVPVVSWALLATNDAGVTVGNELIASGAEDTHLSPYLSMFPKFPGRPGRGLWND
jgi:hypothetical protein